MSTEVVKKRGRPKKASSEPVLIESVEPAKKGLRQKSTKASNPSSARPSDKAAKVLTVTLEDVKIANQKNTNITPASTVAGKKLPPYLPPTPPEKESESFPVPLNPSTATSPPKVTPADSKILNQVRALSSKAPPAVKGSRPIAKPSTPTPPLSSAASKETKHPSQTNSTKPLAPLPSWKPTLAHKSHENLLSSAGVSNTSSRHSAIPSTSQPQSQPPLKSIPIAAINSSIVSQISSRAGARPGRPPNELPPNYKSAARRVTFAMVALPVVIVTSWVLYQRLVLGEERKLLVRPGMVMVEGSPSTTETDNPLSEKGV